MKRFLYKFLSDGKRVSETIKFGVVEEVERGRGWWKNRISE